jgi:8-oxo-dGTP diphosphatase
VRETEEETGYRPVLGRRVNDVHYSVGEPPQPKMTRYFAGRVRAGAFSPNGEVDELRWLVPTDACGLLSYSGDRTTVGAFTALPADTRTALLVRHAKAGNRSAWTGADSLRPLSRAGWAQAEALRGLLALFGPTRVHAATRLRCAQTVAGLAEDLGVPVVPESLLTEEAHAQDPKAATSRLLRLVEGDGAVVIASQGGAIPGMISRLAAASGLAIDPFDGTDRGNGLDLLPCKKGSVWVLSFTPRPPYRLVAADYLASALPAPAAN